MKNNTQINSSFILTLSVWLFQLLAIPLVGTLIYLLLCTDSSVKFVRLCTILLSLVLASSIIQIVLYLMVKAAEKDRQTSLADFIRSHKTLYNRAFWILDFIFICILIPIISYLTVLLKGEDVPPEYKIMFLLLSGIGAMDILAYCLISADFMESLNGLIDDNNFLSLPKRNHIIYTKSLNKNSNRIFIHLIQKLTLYRTACIKAGKKNDLYIELQFDYKSVMFGEVEVYALSMYDNEKLRFLSEFRFYFIDDRTEDDPTKVTLIPLAIRKEECQEEEIVSQMTPEGSIDTTNITQGHLDLLNTWFWGLEIFGYV